MWLKKTDQPEGAHVQHFASNFTPKSKSISPSKVFLHLKY